MQHEPEALIARMEERTEDLVRAMRRLESIKRSIDTHGGRIVSNEIVALATLVICNGGIGPAELIDVMQALKLGKIVPFDPATHTGGNDELLPGDPYLLYSPEVMRLLEHGREHLAPVNGRLN